MNKNYYAWPLRIALAGVLLLAGCSKDDNENDNAIFSILPAITAIEFSADGQEAYSGGKTITPAFSVITNRPAWDVIVTPAGSWCSVAKNGHTFILTATPNTQETAPAAATVTVTASGSTPVVIALTQQAAAHGRTKTGNWKRVENFGGTGRAGAVTFPLGDAVYMGTGLSRYGEELKDFWSSTVSSGDDLRWREADDLPSDFKPRYGGIAFSDGTHAYVGLGGAANAKLGASGIKEYMRDMWRFNGPGQGWSRLRDFPGIPRQYAVSFYIPKSGGGGKAYVVCGYYSLDDDNMGEMTDWWEYDPETDKWRQLCYDDGYEDGVGEKRTGACAAVIGETAYIFTGGIGGGTYPTDVIKFTPYAAVKFTKLDALTNSNGRDYNRIPRAYATAFTVGSEDDQSARIYLVGGERRNVLLDDCWEFNPYAGEKGEWTEVTGLPAGQLRQASVSFTLQGKGYVTTGGSSFFYAGNCYTQWEGMYTNVDTYVFEPGKPNDESDD